MKTGDMDKIEQLQLALMREADRCDRLAAWIGNGADGDIEFERDKDGTRALLREAEKAVLT